jgi:SAM-dependent methyltransferase
MRDLSSRSTEHELLDEDNIEFNELLHCLRSLEFINTLTLAYRPTLRWLKVIFRQHKNTVLRVIDAGSGSGDMLRKIETLASLEQVSVNLLGVDLNPNAKKVAQTLHASTNIQHLTANIFSFNSPESVDVVISSLFTHHLTDKQIIEFLQWMDKITIHGWFINDLHRHCLPYYFIKIATALFSRNRLIRNDAAVSVARAFTKSDWQRLIKRAHISSEVRIKWHFPFRYCLSCHKI